MQETRGRISPLYFLLALAPIAIALEFVGADQTIVFLASAVAIVPLAKLIGDSAEHLEAHYGALLSSLLNVTSGNAAELIIALVALSARTI